MGIDENENTDVQTSPSPKRKKRAVAIGVIAAIVIVAGAGFWVWHEQPSFCNAICHTPMDPYLPTYEATPGEQAVDKWGNTVDDASGMMAAVHRVDDGATCMSCHVPSIGEQVSEGLAWATGSYEVYDNETYGYSLEEKTLVQLTAARGATEDEFCLNEACHNMTRSDLVAATSDMTLNPHISQHGELSCGDCHKAHRASVLTCTKCHEDADVPEGWLAYDEEQALL